MIVPNRKILVVDDDPHVLEAYDEILVSAGNSEADELMRMLTDDFSLESDESQRTVEAAKDAFELVSATSGEEAVQLFMEAQEQGEPFSTVFLDIRMPPGMDGVECSGQIRRIDPHVYIVVVSAYSDYSLDEIHTHLGHDFVYLRKPFIPEELFQVARVFSYYWTRDRMQHEKLTRVEQALEQCRHQLNQ